MCECWSNEPDHRPTFEAISKTIKRLERCHKVSPVIPLYVVTGKNLIKTRLTIVGKRGLNGLEYKVLGFFSSRNEFFLRNVYMEDRIMSETRMRARVEG